MLLVSFYNKFHKKSSIQSKVITKNNFTYRIVLSIVDKFIHNNNLSILDFGCGVGTLSLYLANKGNKVTGIDISKRAVRLAIQSANSMRLQDKAKFYTLSNGKKEVKDRMFDLVLCIEVIEHIEDDKGLISYLSNHLNKSGVLVISTPSINAPLHKLGLAKDFDERVGHLRRYKLDSLVRMVKDQGLKVIDVTRTEGIVRNSLYIFPLLGELIRFIRGPISDFVTGIDNLTVRLFGESDIFIICQKN